MKKLLAIAACLFGLVTPTLGCAQGLIAPQPAPTPTVDQIESVMWAELDAWFPRCVNQEEGGFHAEYDDQWKPLEDPSAALVFQARMTWVAAEVAIRRPERRDEYTAYAKHGLQFLSQAMWDKEFGGFYWHVARAGQPKPANADLKHIYGIGFAIYAAANTHRLCGDEASLQLAQDAYRWVEEHAADLNHGGYTEALDRTGRPLEPSLDEDGQLATDVIGTAIGYKSMNTHIHLLEAYTALYRVWPDPDLRQDLSDLLAIVADKIYVEPGCLNLFFTPDWRALPDHNSFGHNVETTYLLFEAAEVLSPEAVAEIEAQAAQLTDQAIAYGLDHQQGGLYDAGTAFRPPYDKTKVWWAQAEALNAFHLMSIHAETPERYRNAFAETWSFIQEHSIDQELGGWWWSVDADGARIGRPGKGNDWKSAYHTVRALLEVSDRMNHPHNHLP